MGVDPDVLSYSAAVTVLAREFQLEEAFGVLREMSESGLAPSASSVCCEEILEVYGRVTRTRTEELVAFVRAMEEPDFFAYSVAIAVCAAAAATEFRSSSLSSSSASSGLGSHAGSGAGSERGSGSGSGSGSSVPNSAANNAVAIANNVDTDTDRRQWQQHAGSNQAPALLREMTAAGLRPDEACYTNALSSCRDYRQDREAVAILREMSEAGLPLDGVVYTLVSRAVGVGLFVSCLVLCRALLDVARCRAPRTPPRPCLPWRWGQRQDAF